MRRAVSGLMAMLLMIILTGCTYQGRQLYLSEGSGSGNIFRIDDLYCSESEARIYLANYRNLYGTVAGLDLWTSNFDTERMGESIRDTVLEHLTTVYAMNVYAAQQGEELNEDELSRIADAAAEYYATLNDTELAYTGADEDDIRQMYEKYALAEKVYFGLMNTVDEEVSEDEARVMDAYILYMTDGQRAEELAAEVAGSEEDFESLVNTYSEGPKNVVSFARGTYPAEIEEVVFALDNGQISGLLSDADGYYYFQCVNVYNAELSEENKANVIAERKAALFDEIISMQQSTYYSYIDEEAWEALTIPLDDGIVTDSFFEILDGYISYAN